jgi:excisionase family DNA binding protein
MDDNQKISQREQQRRARQRAMTIDEFCETYSLGRTKAYAELRSGRLRGRKVGKRTIISEDDAEEWLTRLPVLRSAQ